MNASARLTRLGLGLGLVLGLAACNNDPSPPPPSPTRPPLAIASIELTAVGDIVQGQESQPTMVVQLAEAAPAAIARGSGSLQVILTDHAGNSDSLQFIGEPVVGGPGSLGATATLNGRNVLTISIIDSDPLNFEPITVSGLGIRASSEAAVGVINAVVGGCSGSLAGCTATDTLPSPGVVVAP